MNALGIGAKKQSPCPLSKDEEEKFRSTGTVGFQSSRDVGYDVFFSVFQNLQGFWFLCNE